MKKLLMVFASIALIAIILAAGVFGYSSFKNLTYIKEDKKTEEVSKKKQNKKQDNESNNDDNTDQNQKMNSEQQKQSEQATTENINKGEENKELNLEDEIAKADKNGDGIATTDEMTPELEKLADQGLIQPVTPEMANPENHKEYEEDNGSSSEDEDMSEAYERQKEIYEKQARGELPQPGEGPITEE